MEIVIIFLFSLGYFAFRKKPIKNPTVQQMMQSFDEYTERRSAWIISIVLAVILCGPYFLLNEWFGMSLGVYLLILLSIPFLLYWFWYKNP